jgi:hypothetical protein
MSSTDLAENARDGDNCAVPNSNHTREEVLEGVEVGEKVYADVALDFFDREVKEGFPIDNCSVIDEDRWSTEL